MTHTREATARSLSDLLGDVTRPAPVPPRRAPGI